MIHRPPEVTGVPGLNLTNCRFDSCSAETNLGTACAGGVSLWSGTARISGTIFTSNKALISDTSAGGKGEGGHIYVASGALLMSDGTLMTGGIATHNGGSMFLAGGITSYALPAPPGYWVPALECFYRDMRDGCGGERYKAVCSTHPQCGRETDPPRRSMGLPASL